MNIYSNMRNKNYYYGIEVAKMNWRGNKFYE